MSSLACDMTGMQRQVILRVLPEAIAEEIRLRNADGTLQDFCDLFPEPEDNQAGAPDRMVMQTPVRMSFRAGTRTLPALLVNLPCPVELHRTFDPQGSVYKSADIGQMVIVFDSDEARAKAEAECKPSKDGEYYHSGLTPPTVDITRRRFTHTKTKLSKYPQAKVAQVEQLLMQEINQLVLADKNNQEQRPPSPLVDEEVVGFDEFMWSDEYPEGVTICETDAIAADHPEIFVKGYPLLQTQTNTKQKRSKNQQRQNGGETSGPKHGMASQSWSSSRPQQKQKETIEAYPADEIDPEAEPMLVLDAAQLESEFFNGENDLLDGLDFDLSDPIIS